MPNAKTDPSLRSEAVTFLICARKRSFRNLVTPSQDDGQRQGSAGRPHCAWWMVRNGSCRPSGASRYFNAGLPPLSRWATVFRLWRG